ncbi:Hpt domain-containing protein, partial [Bradyrhizobium sp. STM 3843]|uniref:Hpt domain-containing protein n=1 Tax=Bradyrhizobium sp. STM 3843 TaxID=551947 RepID=UPI00056B0F60
MSVLDATAVFRQEASELLEVLEGTLLDLGQHPHDKDLVDTAFRALHTIKGSGAMFGFDKVAAFTHEFETAFDQVRKGVITPTQELITVALAARDYIRTLIEAPETTDKVIGDAILDDLAQLVSPPAQAPAAAAATTSAIAAPPRAAGWKLYLEFEQHVLRNGSNPLDLLDDLCQLGPCFAVPLTDAIPLLDALEPDDCYLKWDVTLHCDCERSAIDDVFMFVSDEMKLVVTPLAQADLPPRAVAVVEDAPAVVGADEVPVVTAAEAPLAPATVEAAAPAATEPRASTSAAPAIPAAQPTAEPATKPRREEPKRSDERAVATVRVQAERLDELMDRVGELVIAQARLSQLAATSSDLSIKMIAEEIERLAGSLRDTTMGARMVPIGSLFGRFRRLVHDLSRDLNKPVEFITVGEDTELDKTMIECL